MRGYTITMRVWTCLGKENIFSIDYYHIRNNKLIITDDREQHICRCVGAGKPCCISFLSNNDFEYRVEEFRQCSLDDKGEIIFEEHTINNSTS